jgi:hypothetical protein
MFTLEGPRIVMSRTDAQNGLDFHFKGFVVGNFECMWVLHIYWTLRPHIGITLEYYMNMWLELNNWIL